MTEQWLLTSKRADFNAIASRFQISPVLARLMRNRDLITDDEMRSYLYGTMKDLPSSHLLKDVDLAAEIMLQKIQQKRKIRIISDYDVDGVSSNYILWNGLRRCGADVDYRIPDRIEDGYGINIHLIDQAKTDSVDTIITCDNGIAAIDQIAYANSLGMTVIVTDHHDIPYEEIEGNMIYHVPDAAAVVNPKQKDCNYPFKSICGAVVSMKFIEVLYEKCGIARKEIEAFYTMATLATVCDVMPLRGENRILVKAGLAQIQDTDIIGLRALLQANELRNHRITAYHLGFIIGPCINASGRLATARQAMELLICQDEEKALAMAIELTKLNEERKEMTKKGVEQAIDYLESTGHCKDKVLIVLLEDCHESIAGIIAGRVREYYNKPSFVLTKTKNGVKGSGRSIEAYQMFEEMTKVKDCFTKYGGHPMAAGLSMEEEKVEELRQRLNANTSLEEKDFISTVRIDIAVPLYYISEHFIEELSMMEPFGMENEKPLFAQKDLQICSLKVLGNSGRCVKMYVKDAAGNGMDALYFGEADHFVKEMEEHFGKDAINRIKRGLYTNVKMHVTYYPQMNEWRGERTLQIVIQNYRFA
ncbi:MAG: single-stranded-DNA-specific exonuclease RecJ [Eubacteriales bacterium]|nr:single-stranded-DNA-specific exonuclease RecJ [Eubacteriales bacterium]